MYLIVSIYIYIYIYIWTFHFKKAISSNGPDTKQCNEIQKKNNTKISVIVANLSGAERALKHENVDILGFSISRTLSVQ